jgi:cyclic-di-GMP phosphodiesterase, flagellum assembly factor TipF
MTKTIGLRAGAGYWLAIAAATAGGLALIALSVLFAPAGAAALVPGVLALGGLGLAAAAMAQMRRLKAQAAKLSGDLDIVSLRLLRLEAAPAAAAKTPDPRLAAGLGEVVAEIGVMSSIMRDVANAVAAHERDIARMHGEIGRAPARVAPVRPEPRPSAPPAPLPRPEPLAPPSPPAEPAPEHPVAAILEAFAGERLELHLQPVVTLPQRKVRFYEALARLKLADGTLLVPAEFLPVLEERGLMPELDRKVLARAAAIARHLGTRGSEALVACNLAAASLSEPGFLRGIGRLLDASPDLSGRLILELSQRSWRTLDAETAGALAQLRDRGLAFALDRATDLRLDPLSLADRGVRFVKIAAEMLLEPEALRGLDVEIHDLAAVLARAGIKLVAERVEREEDVPNLLDIDVPMAQGFVFAPPRPVRAEVLSQAVPAQAPEPPPAAPPEEAPPAAPETPQRMPFRSFLRRAG